MRRKPSWETTANSRWSGEKANSLRLPLPIDQRASGLRASLLFFYKRVNRGRYFLHSWTNLCVGNGKVLLFIFDHRIDRLNGDVALTVQLFIEYVQTATGVGNSEIASWQWKPFDTCHLRFIEITLATETVAMTQFCFLSSSLTPSLNTFCSLLCMLIYWICPLEKPTRICKTWLSTCWMRSWQVGWWFCL